MAAGTTSLSDLQEGTSMGHKRSRREEGESTVQKKKAVAFEKSLVIRRNPTTFEPWIS